ncbi:DUF3086 domain-containing protein [Allocoleopsis franciscana]|uniref:Uncharacterized protein n=1 Tax=Allocoleopsis franciscana PCC 7113 TaxID=1173027 RepID=K9WKK8_9CYAN|nr:DUF3086 domain-containing protein [Allocoleopsis franciscana]AFZ20945.1 Protein of unknown function (DUF3086) [Allocoleopsis franciscana PCC 7113]
MNSDETQTPEQEPVKKLAVEAFEEQQPELEAEALEELEPLTPKDEVPVQLADDQPQLDLLSSTDAGLSDRAWNLTNLEEKKQTAEPAQPLERERMADLTQTVADLQRQEQELRQKIAVLQETQVQLLSEQLAKTQAAVEQIVQEGVQELEQRKQALQISIEQLERRRERIRTEMRTTFAGVSQDLAIRVQGFKDYLVGSLQDLTSAAEQLELTPPSEPPRLVREEYRQPDQAPTPKFAEQGFQEQIKQIRNILDQYRSLPDYYGPSWQLRRTFEPIHAERVSNWFFTQGGRGALKTMGSRLQNILIASAIISVLHTLYGNRQRTLILANTPERLGEWRRGLQDCLGISRSDFGPEQGITLFEEAPVLVQKADRLLAQKQLPLIIVDETEDQINLSMLQFPLWLAFAPDPQQMPLYQY